MTDQTITPDAWGKQVLEELLFRVAERMDDRNTHTDVARVALTFEVRANVAHDCLDVCLPEALDGPLVLSLPRPF